MHIILKFNINDIVHIDTTVHRMDCTIELY